MMLTPEWISDVDTIDMMARFCQREKKWRPVAALVLFTPTRLCFVGRQNNPELNWSTTQGGIEEGEGFVETIFRELEEEIGIGRDMVEIVSICLLSAKEPPYIPYASNRIERHGYSEGEVYFVAGARLKASGKVHIRPDKHGVIEILDHEWLTPRDAVHRLMEQPGVDSATRETRFKGEYVLKPAIELMCVLC